MPSQVQVMLRTSEAYTLAERAIAEMQRRKVWPTPLNFEIWLHIVAEPDGALAAEVDQLARRGEPLTEARSEELASVHLPSRRATDNLRDAGDMLSRELESVTQAIQDAQRSSADYGRTLAGVSAEVQEGAPAVQTLIRTLADATRRIQSHNATLERRLDDSTREVRRLRENLDVVRRDAMTDALTNLANRKAFDEGLARAVAETESAGQPLTLAIIDIDHFKTFNDTWGHQTGDQVIRFVASVIDRLGGAPRMAARYGGEEFAVIFPGEKAHAVCRILESVLMEIASRTLKRRSSNEDLGAVTVSAGVAERRPSETGATLISRADQALYASKRGGRNRVTSAELPPFAAVA